MEELYKDVDFFNLKEYHLKYSLRSAERLSSALVKIKKDKELGIHRDIDQSGIVYNERKLSQFDLDTISEWLALEADLANISDINFIEKKESWRKKYTLPPHPNSRVVEFKDKAEYGDPSGGWYCRKFYNKTEALHFNATVDEIYKEFGKKHWIQYEAAIRQRRLITIASNPGKIELFLKSWNMRDTSAKLYKMILEYPDTYPSNELIDF